MKRKARDPRKCYRIFFVRCFFREAYSTSSGSSGTGEIPEKRSVEEGSAPARGKRVPEAEINGLN
ncbi:hypothetical protein E4O93_05790 [Diaphorobacter sp. DS2]|nr:hypothetical protein E4O93_05790 [Diaphorobacter sp. DS2]